jgi:hypothetical protein
VAEPNFHAELLATVIEREEPEFNRRTLEVMRQPI